MPVSARKSEGLNMVEQDLELRKLQQEHQRLLLDWELGRKEPVFRFAEIALRSLLLLNGGAAISLLTFAGNAERLGLGGKAGVLGNMALSFGAGAALAVLTALLAYLTQHSYASFEPKGPKSEQTRANRRGNLLRWIAVCVAFLSWGAFLLGMVLAQGLFTP